MQILQFYYLKEMKKNYTIARISASKTLIAAAIALIAKLG
jgi:hypothetical protein